MSGEYVECIDCGFVLLAEGADAAVPDRVDSCPDCGSVSFRFTE